MTNQERFNKYKIEQCKRCSNRDSDMCEIRIFVRNGIIYTKCVHYELDANYCMKRKCNKCKNKEKCFKERKNEI